MGTIALGQVKYGPFPLPNPTPSSIQKPRPPPQTQKREANSICLCWTLQTFPTERKAFKKEFSSLLPTHPSTVLRGGIPTSQDMEWQDHPEINCKAGQVPPPSFFPTPRSLCSNYQWFSGDFRLWNTPVNSNPLTLSHSLVVYNAIDLTGSHRQHKAPGDLPQWSHAPVTITFMGLVKL